MRLSIPQRPPFQRHIYLLTSRNHNVEGCKAVADDCGSAGDGDRGTFGRVVEDKRLQGLGQCRKLAFGMGWVGMGWVAVGQWGFGSWGVGEVNVPI